MPLEKYVPSGLRPALPKDCQRFVRGFAESQMK
jgi:hypothetical protein